MIRKIAEDISQDLLSKNNRQRKLQGNRLDKLIMSVEKLIRDSVSIRFSRSRMNLASIKKRPAAYTKGRYNSRLSYRIHVQLAYEGMCRLGYLEEVKAGVSHGAIGLYLTRYKATAKLIRCFKEVELATLPVIAGPEPIDETIRVQIKEPEWNAKLSRMDTRKRLVEYTDTDETQIMRNNLLRINQAISSRWIDLELSDEGFSALQARMRARDYSFDENDKQLDLTRTQLYRVFNDTGFRTGGRFYGGWWQNIPKEYRSMIIINGSRTVEADFSSLHPAIIYAKKGLEPPVDAYGNILPDLPRGVAKQAFFAMVNAHKFMQSQPRGMKLSTYGYKWADVVEAMVQRHETIKDAFFSGTGGHLQRLDSELAERVMLSFIAYPSPVAILPMHDSFIIHRGYEAELKEFMELHFAKMFGQTINIDVEYSSHEANSTTPVTTDLDELLAMQAGHDKRLTKFHSIKQ